MFWTQIQGVFKQFHLSVFQGINYCTTIEICLAFKRYSPTQLFWIYDDSIKYSKRKCDCVVNFALTYKKGFHLKCKVEKNPCNSSVGLETKVDPTTRPIPTTGPIPTSGPRISSKNQQNNIQGRKNKVAVMYPAKLT